MDEFRQLSVTFPDCFVSSVLGTVSVVTFTSYNFSTGGKQHGSLFRSFIERYMKISFSGVFFVFSFNHQIIQVKCFGIYKLESVRSMVKFFQNFLDRTADFYQIFSMVFIYIFSFFSTFSFKFSHISLQHNTGRWGFQLCGQSSRCSPSFASKHFSQIQDSWHDLVLFSELFHACFFFSFFLTSFPKVQQPYAWRIIVACMHRWHAKPFYLL